MLKLNDTTHRIVFRLTDSLDNRTGLDVDPDTIGVQVAVPEQTAFSAGGGSVQKIGSGWYGYTPTSSEVGATGVGALQADHPEAAVPALVTYPVVDNEPWGTIEADNRDGEKIPTAAEIWTKTLSTLQGLAAWASSVGEHVVSKTDLLTQDTDPIIAPTIQQGDVIQLTAGGSRLKSSGREIRLPYSASTFEGLGGFKVRFALERLVADPGGTDEKVEVDAEVANPNTDQQELVAELTRDNTSNLATDETPINELSQDDTGRAYRWEFGVHNGAIGVVNAVNGDEVTLDDNASTIGGFYVGQNIIFNEGEGNELTAEITSSDGGTTTMTLDQDVSSDVAVDDPYRIVASDDYVAGFGEASVLPKSTSVPTS